jgi:hypothetical protein
MARAKPNTERKVLVTGEAVASASPLPSNLPAPAMA